MTPPRLAIRDLSIRLGAHEALRGVAFDIATPGLVALVGPNGAGKSTLLRGIAGLLPFSSGEIAIAGRSVANWSTAERARRIAYLPQERAVHWPLQARAIVGLGRLPHQQHRTTETDADRHAIDRALAAMDATHLAARPVLDLSGGERARVLMARALAQEPEVLLADEPAAGLDPAHQWALFEHLETAASGIRVVVALHELALAWRFAAHVILLAGGRVVAAGPPYDVLSPERLADVFGISAAVVDVGGRSTLVTTGRR